METFNFNKTIVTETDDGVQETVVNYKVYYQSGMLTVSRLEISETGESVEVPLITQPWKCLPDGSRSDFVDAEDALAWLETVKDTII